MGAWIEIVMLNQIYSNITSLPPWERGLKSMVTQGELDLKWSLPPWERGLKYLKAKNKKIRAYVAPPVGAWIEI